MALSMQWLEGSGQEWKSWARFLYADDVCLIASSEEDMRVIMKQVKDCAIEYGLKVYEKKCKVVCINCDAGKVDRMWEIAIWIKQKIK